MNGELLTALERLEREKGIKKEVLFAAIESALTSAAYKIIDGNATAKDEITVKMNEETGEIKVYKGKQEVKSDQFGRIAAQTAKQVMIQKIREAERDVVYNKYLQMEGTIISGSVHRFEKGNIVVELDDTEGVLLKSGQIPRERFRQGQPIRAFLQKVERKTGGLEIILSRANCGFVQRLFEMEVPEITQGIVEIKAIAREAGERTKIAVESTEDKIDAVGACVGMRGSRVKEIVKELSGERIDIVRWSDDIEEYIKSAVSPAEIYSMEIDSENKTIKLIFPKDQLSALIGKRGRNIRLISKLVGWEIQAEAKEEKIILSLSEVPGINEEVLHILEKAGYNNTSEVVETDVENISVVEGMDAEKAASVMLACNAAIELVRKTREDALVEHKDVAEDNVVENKPEDAENSSGDAGNDNETK